jgi:hypothetical protein
MQLDLHVVVSHADMAAANSAPAALKNAAVTQKPQFCRVIFWRGESELKTSFELLPDAHVVLVDVKAYAAKKDFKHANIDEATARQLDHK